MRRGCCGRRWAAARSDTCPTNADRPSRAPSRPVSRPGCRVVDAGVHAEPTGWGEQVRGVAAEQHPARAVALGDQGAARDPLSRVEDLNSSGAPHALHDKPPDRVVVGGQPCTA